MSRSRLSPRSPCVALSAALVLAVVSAGPPATAQVAVRPAGADGRFTTALDPKSAVPGFTDRQVATFRIGLDGLTAALAAMSEVNTPTAPLCMRLSSWVEIQSERGLLEASVDVSRPVIIDGRCTELQGATIQFWLNRTDSLLMSRLEVGAAPNGQPWYVLPITQQSDGYLAVEDDGEQIEVYTRAGTPFLAPVTWAEFSAGGGADIWTQADYDVWLAHDYKDIVDAARRDSATNGSSVPAELRAEVLAAFEEGLNTQAEMMRSMIGQPRTQIEQLTGRPFSQPPQSGASVVTASASTEVACWIDYRAQASTNCPAHSRLMKVNPAYFNLEQADQVQLVLLRTSREPESEDAAAYAGRRAIWDALDRKALADLVTQ